MHQARASPWATGGHSSYHTNQHRTTQQRAMSTLESQVETTGVPQQSWPRHVDSTRLLWHDVTLSLSLNPLSLALINTGLDLDLSNPSAGEQRPARLVD